jgi:hypothetical protein
MDILASGCGIQGRWHCWLEIHRSWHAHLIGMAANHPKQLGFFTKQLKYSGVQVQEEYRN